MSALKVCPVHRSPEAIRPFHVLFPDLEFPQLPSHMRTRANAFSSFKTYVANHACNACCVSLSSLPLPRSPSPTLSQSPSFSPVLPFFPLLFSLSKSVVPYDALSDSLCWYLISQYGNCMCVCVCMFWHAVFGSMSMYIIRL